MAISTNSIIHYTDELEKIKSIIREGFKVKYCLEKFVTISSDYEVAHPMISFCDIPLSDSVRHFDLYGCYGIGLNKNWAKEKGINPVLYIEQESYLGESLFMAATAVKDNMKTEKPEVLYMIASIKLLSKNYSGPLEHRKIKTDNYKFYDEREWRFIPTPDDINNQPLALEGNDYNKCRDDYNNKISHFRCQFEHTDISYIIVKKTDEIPSIIKFLKDLYKEVEPNELDILISKVCSTEQIIADY